MQTVQTEIWVYTVFESIKDFMKQNAWKAKIKKKQKKTPPPTL